MNIAIGTEDGVTVCSHLARSSAFHVLETEDGRIVSRTVRERIVDGCGNHTSFVELLAGCHVVICGGIGEGAVRSLTANGIQPLVVVSAHLIDEALALYLAGKLATTSERVCLCH